MLRIQICIKQVPGSSNVEVDPVTGVLKRDGADSKLNPYDLYALELGLQLAADYGGSTAVLTMGPPQARRAVEEAMMMGVERGTILSDRCFAGADVLATSYTLAQGLRSQGDYDLILCGKQTTDGDTAQVGPELAEHLGIPHLTNVEAVLSLGDGRVTVRCRSDELVTVQSVTLPCLLCTEGGINTPRLPSYRRKQTLDGSKITILTLADMEDTTPGHYGLEGSPTQVVKIFPPEKRGDKEMWQDSGEDLGQRLHSLLVSKKFLQERG